MLSSSFSSMVLSEEPVITFIPTGVTASGRKNVQEMERTFISQVRNASIEPVQVSYFPCYSEVISNYSTGNGFVEEAILRLAHEENIDWLLPGVKPTRKTIMLPIVKMMH